MLTSRPYQGLKDFEQLKSILVDGRRAATNAYYVHVGDIAWWLFYNDQTPQAWKQSLCLWESDGRTIGWSLLSEAFHSFDVFVHPQVRGTAREAKMLLWAEECLAARMRAKGRQAISMYWVAEDDDLRTRWLSLRGFEAGDYFMHAMTRELDQPLPEPVLPEGYQVRGVAGRSEMRKRAAASYAAFGSSRDFEAYWPRYARFMHSPVYNPDLDIVAVAPDGQVAAFCIVWPDPVTGVGLFEPVGTHPDFQRRGLGRAVVLEGLRRLKALGMTSALVCAESDNPAAKALYEATGFRPAKRLYTFEKPLI